MATPVIIELPPQTQLQLASGMTLQLIGLRTPYPTPAGATGWHDAQQRPYVDAPAFVVEVNGSRGEAWVEPAPGPDGQRHILLTRAPGEPAARSERLSPLQITQLTEIYRQHLQPEAPAQALR